MRIAPVSDVSNPAPAAAAAGGGGGCGAAVCLAVVDERGLSDVALDLRLKVLGRAESQITAMRSRALAELARRSSNSDAQRVARDKLQLSGRQAKRDVETATQLTELPATSEALASGEIPTGHARLIARAAAESPVDEGMLVEAANTQPFDEFAKTVKRHQRDTADDERQSLLDRQRAKRKVRMFESADSGMFVLNAELDPIAGARIATALTAQERKIWHAEDPNNRATPQQRMADALTEAICQPAGSGGGSVGTDLLVIADYDTIAGQLGNPRLADGTPIPADELHKLAVTANILPSIFDAKTQKMWLGHRQRTASQAQRIALTARDRGCVGCGANALWCRAHHVKYWRDGGTTDLDNLVLVCDDCHHKIHDHNWQIHQHPTTGQHTLKPPTNTTEPPSRTASRHLKRSARTHTVEPPGRSPTRPPHPKPPANTNTTEPAPNNRPAPYAQPGTITINIATGCRRDRAPPTDQPQPPTNQPQPRPPKLLSRQHVNIHHQVSPPNPPHPAATPQPAPGKQTAARRPQPSGASSPNTQNTRTDIKQQPKAEHVASATTDAPPNSAVA